jgi:GAF domain/Stage II sporulation protein E (SpoIIE)
MTEESVDMAADDTSAPSGNVPDGPLHAALESVIAVSGEASDAAGATQAIVDRLVTDLELARARLFMLSSEGAGAESTHLETVAAAGSHATFTKEMPSVPLDGSTDVARVGESGEAEFHGDVHGLGEEPEGGHTGLGRWRAAVTTQSSAALPLSVRGRMLGVLALEWSAPRAFEAAERADLDATATAAALVVDSFLAEERAIVPQLPAVGITPSPTAELAVTADGMVVPAGIPGAWASSLALALHVAADASGAHAEEVFWDVVGLPGGLVVLSLGMALTSQGSASEVAETARHMLRASALQGAGPARSLELLAGWIAASGPGNAWVSAVMVEIQAQRSTASWCAAGSVALASRLADGRLDIVGAEHPPLGSTASPDLVEHDALLLKGDRVALVCGEVAALSAESGKETVKSSLANGAKPETLVELVRTPSSVAGAIVVEVVP